MIREKKINTPKIRNYSLGIDNKVYAKLYVYDDDNCIYFSSFKTKQKYRKCGYGNNLLNLCVCCAKKFDYDYMRLWVLENSWQHEWYKKFGFVDLDCYYDENKEYVWMELNLKHKIKINGSVWCINI